MSTCERAKEFVHPQCAQPARLHTWQATNPRAYANQDISEHGDPREGETRRGLSESFLEACGRCRCLHERGLLGLNAPPMSTNNPQGGKFEDLVNGDLYFIALVFGIGNDIITLDQTPVMSVALQMTVEPAKPARSQQQPFITLPQASLVGEVLTPGNQSALQILESILMATPWPLPTM